MSAWSKMVVICLDHQNTSQVNENTPEQISGYKRDHDWTISDSSYSFAKMLTIISFEAFIQEYRCCAVLYMWVWFDFQVCLSRKNGRVNQQTDSACRVLWPERSQLSHWSNTCQVERDASVQQWGMHQSHRALLCHPGTENLTCAGGDSCYRWDFDISP